jgi:hypothetical protein
MVLAAIVFFGAPVPARAEGFFSPFVGPNFANNSVDLNRSAKGKLNFGFDVGAMSNGIAGGEFDFGYAPNFFGEKGAYGENHVMTAMGNFIVGIPVGGTRGGGIRPYGTVGMGLIRTQVTGTPGTTGVPKIGNNDLGMNAGAGVMGFFGDHVGLRADLRYFRNLQGNTIDAVDWGSFHFWRGSIGLVLR